jgi:hypothetical protein
LKLLTNVEATGVDCGLKPLELKLERLDLVGWLKPLLENDEKFEGAGVGSAELKEEIVEVNGFDEKEGLTVLEKFGFG